MDRHERLSTLTELIAARGTIDISDAAELLHASAATIRRDLTYLDEQRLVTRTHGGAVANAVSFDLPLRLKSRRAPDEKHRIAKRAANLVAGGSAIALNGGTTELEVARALALRTDFNNWSGPEPALTVVTNAVNVAAELLVRPYLRVVVTGGVVRAHSYELYGPLADRSIKELHVDTAILGVDGYDPTFGASAFSTDEASVSSRFVASAHQVIVVADSSKIGVTTFARICLPEQVNVLITDTGIDPALRADIEALGTEVHAV